MLKVPAREARLIGAPSAPWKAPFMWDGLGRTGRGGALGAVGAAKTYYTVVVRGPPSPVTDSHSHTQVVTGQLTYFTNYYLWHYL